MMEFENMERIQSNISSIDDIDEEYKQLNEMADVIYKFVMLYSEYAKKPRDYGIGEPITMVEAHTLTAIEENPGITNNELVAMWGRTKGAVSQTVSKLEKKGLIIKERGQVDGRNTHYKVTISGEQLSIAHKRYDIAELKWAERMLRNKFTADDIKNFYEIVRYYTSLLESEN